jgi:transposase-like protein
MEFLEQVECPFCGQDCSVTVNAGERAQRFTTDCETCCRPFEVMVECESGAILRIEAQAG